MANHLKLVDFSFVPPSTKLGARPIATKYFMSYVQSHKRPADRLAHSANPINAVRAAVVKIMTTDWIQADVYDKYGLPLYRITKTAKGLQIKRMDE